MPPGDASESAHSRQNTHVRGNPVLAPGELTFDTPRVDDGPHVWDLAANTGTLDVNSRYAYVLWCRDFADTTVVVRDADRLAGFLVGYRRPQAPDTFFTWQVAVGDDYRRRGLARRMLDHVVGSLRPQGVRFVEATVTPDNKASIRLFESFAEANGANMRVDVLFSERELGSGHQPEMLHRIGPLED